MALEIRYNQDALERSVQFGVQKVGEISSFICLVNASNDLLYRRCT